MSLLEPAGLTEKLGGAEEVERLEQGLLWGLQSSEMGIWIGWSCTAAWDR